MNAQVIRARGKRLRFAACQPPEAPSRRAPTSKLDRPGADGVLVDIDAIEPGVDAAADEAGCVGGSPRAIEQLARAACPIPHLDTRASARQSVNGMRSRCDSSPSSGYISARYRALEIRVYAQCTLTYFSTSTSGSSRVLLFIRTQKAWRPSLIRATTGADDRAMSTLQTSSWTTRSIRARVRITAVC